MKDNSVSSSNRAERAPGRKLRTAALAGALALTALALIFIPRVDSHAENIGQVTQPLVGGQPVSTGFQEQFGLVTVVSQTSPTSSASCSGSLLNNNWIISAAHCFTLGNISNPASVTITANWSHAPGATQQQVNASAIISFRNTDNLDIAIVHLATPINTFGTTTSFHAQAWGENYQNLRDYPIEIFGRGRNQLASNVGGTPVPSSTDGLYRYGNGSITYLDSESGNLYWYTMTPGQATAGGDSGGPSYATIRVGRVLTGVHALCHVLCLPGQACGGGSWTWVSSIPECADAPVTPIWSKIVSLAKPDVVPPPPPPPPQFVGTFSTAPPPDSPDVYLYAIAGNGNLLWYLLRDGKWQGPKQVGNGWGRVTNLLSVDFNSLGAIGANGDLTWYRHNGIGDGTFDWSGPKKVGNGWGNFKKVFSGGQGVVYALTNDGKLLWYRDPSFGIGGAVWQGPNVIATNWGDVVDAFSMGNGVLYAVKANGDLVWLKHAGFLDGSNQWQGAMVTPVGTGWAGFRAIIPAGNGVILAVKPDGTMLWYRHRGWENGTGAGTWDGPRQIGNGWSGFRAITAVLPPTTPSIVR